MTDKTINNGRKVNGDYFILIYSRKSNKNLQYYIDQFDIDDYYIYKSTNSFKEITKEELYEFKHARYTFFKKDVYDKQHIDNWIYKIKGRRLFFYLDKPFPPFDPEKIKVIECTKQVI